MTENIKQKPRIKVGALGGLDENGKNCLVIEVDDDIFVVEAGLKFPDNFTPGVEFITPLYDYLKENVNRVKAIIISHGHDDIYGGLPYLLRALDGKVPCYLTKTTLCLLRADFANRFNLDNFNFITIAPSSEVTIASHRFSFFSTTHSVAESFGFVIHTDLGNIVYTGDFITDYNGLKNYTFDFAKIASIANEGNTLLLLTESNGADKPGICSPNHRLTPHIKDLIEDQVKRLFIAVYTQNFYNIQEIIDLAVANDKKIVIVNKRLLDALPELNKNGALLIPKNIFCTPEDMIRYSTSDLIILITGSGEELFNLITSLTSEQSAPLNLKIVENDQLVMACPSVPGTEVIATEALDAVYQCGAEVRNLTRKKISSMHAHEEDLKMMLSLFRPRYYMPVKGEYRLLMANAKLALSTGLGYNYFNTIIFDNGMVLGIDANKKVIQNLPRMKEGDIMVDGSNVGGIKESVLAERQSLADDGIVIISVAISTKQQRVVSNTDVQMKGFIYLKDQENIRKEIIFSCNEVVHEMMTKKLLSPKEGERRIIERLSKYFRHETKKNPYIQVQIVNIDLGKK